MVLLFLEGWLLILNGCRLKVGCMVLNWKLVMFVFGRFWCNRFISRVVISGLWMIRFG